VWQRILRRWLASTFYFQKKKMNFLNDFFTAVGGIFSPIDYADVDWEIGDVDEGNRFCSQQTKVHCLIQKKKNKKPPAMIDIHFRGDASESDNDSVVSASVEVKGRKAMSLLDLHDDVFEVFEELNEEIFSVSDNVQENVKQLLSQKRDALRQKQLEIKLKLQTKPVVKLLDKLTFLFSVLNVGKLQTNASTPLIHYVSISHWFFFSQFIFIHVSTDFNHKALTGKILFAFFFVLWKKN
jgi:hypothetical protein